DQLELRFDEVDMLFLAVEDRLEQPARHKILMPLAKRDAFAQRRDRSLLELQVALQNLPDVFADQQLAEILQVRQTFEEQNALDELVGMTHLVDGFLVLVLGELRDTPVLQHPGMKEVLVDGRKLVEKHFVEYRYDLVFALHTLAPLCHAAGPVG